MSGRVGVANLVYVVINHIEVVCPLPLRIGGRFKAAGQSYRVRGRLAFVEIIDRGAVLKHFLINPALDVAVERCGLILWICDGGKGAAAAPAVKGSAVRRVGD